MIKVVTAIYDGKVVCAFLTREECKNYIKKNHPDIDGFDVQISTKYLSDYDNTGYFER